MNNTQGLGKEQDQLRDRREEAQQIMEILSLGDEENGDAQNQSMESLMDIIDKTLERREASPSISMLTS